MRHYKKSAEGTAERLGLLQEAFPPSASIYKTALDRFPAKKLASDDIIDALANAVTATRLEDAVATLPKYPPIDQHGLPMEMVYARAAFDLSECGGEP